MGVLVYIKQVSRYLERENCGGFGDRNIRIVTNFIQLVFPQLVN